MPARAHPWPPTVLILHVHATESISSKPLGTALNGSAWAPGACGPNPTALGYQCSWVGQEGAVLHWTYNDHSSSPPINRCTRQPQAVPNLEIQELDGPTVHFALQAVTKVRRNMCAETHGAAPGHAWLSCREVGQHSMC